jgi:hypothetical protein
MSSSDDDTFIFAMKYISEAGMSSYITPDVQSLYEAVKQKLQLKADMEKALMGKTSIFSMRDAPKVRRVVVKRTGTMVKLAHNGGVDHRQPFAILESEVWNADEPETCRHVSLNAKTLAREMVQCPDCVAPGPGAQDHRRVQLIDGTVMLVKEVEKDGTEIVLSPYVTGMKVGDSFTIGVDKASPNGDTTVKLDILYGVKADAAKAAVQQMASDIDQQILGNTESMVWKSGDSPLPGWVAPPKHPNCKSALVPKEKPPKTLGSPYCHANGHEWVESGSTTYMQVRQCKGCHLIRRTPK